MVGDDDSDERSKEQGGTHPAGVEGGVQVVLTVRSGLKGCEGVDTQ